MNEKKYLIAIFSIIIVLICIIYKISSTTYAYQINDQNYTLFYKDDIQEMTQDIKKYLEGIDDLLITNSDYDTYDILSNNYNYITHFTLDYILKYQEAFQDKIVTLENFNYHDKFYNKKETNIYIPLEVFYDITYKYFGIKDFKNINNDVNIIDKYISLIDYTENNFHNEIKEIYIKEKDKKIYVYVTYDSYQYLYIFWIKNNVLKLYNIEV